MTTTVGVVCCYVKLLESLEKVEGVGKLELYTSGRLREAASRVERRKHATS